MTQGDPKYPPPSRHSLADHDFGALADHRHDDGEHDHDHDEDFADIDTYDRGAVRLLSAGIDIGSSGTQIIFTRLQMHGAGVHRALAHRVKERETLYMSPVAPTPFGADHQINEDKLWDILAQAFQAADLTPDDVETGALILTGEAARRDNARVIAQRIAAECGDLICAAAGHHMEAALAAYGSGLVEASRQGMGRCLLNVDIGGGTTKFAIVDDGHIKHTAAMKGGGRLLVVDRDGRLIRCEPAGALFAQRAGYELKLGDRIDRPLMAAVAQNMAQAILRALVEPDAQDVRDLFVTEPLDVHWLSKVQGLRASGGVAEFIYGREHRDFWDAGRDLGHALNGFAQTPWPLLEAGECIRATAFGASQYTVQLSGQTLFISTPARLLPQRNVLVLRPDLDLSDALSVEAIAHAISAQRILCDVTDEHARFALAFAWRGAPSYERLLILARAIVAGCADILVADGPLYIILDGDVAHNLGAILKNDLHLRQDVLVIDGVAVRDFDYVDIGRIRLPSQSVPVTVKSLLFGAVQKKR